jgi:hypothetical protein
VSDLLFPDRKRAEKIFRGRQCAFEEWREKIFVCRPRARRRTYSELSQEIRFHPSQG